MLTSNAVRGNRDIVITKGQQNETHHLFPQERFEGYQFAKYRRRRHIF